MISGRKRKREREKEREKRKRKRRRTTREKERFTRGEEWVSTRWAKGKAWGREGSLGRALGRLSLTQHSYPGPKCDVILHNSPNCIVAAAALHRLAPLLRRAVSPLRLCPPDLAVRCYKMLPVPHRPSYGEKPAIALTGAHREKERDRVVGVRCISFFQSTRLGAINDKFAIGPAKQCSKIANEKGLWLL